MSRQQLTRQTRREDRGDPRTGRRAAARWTAVGVAVTGVAVVAGWASRYSPSAPGTQPGASAGAVPTSTATVIRTSITASQQDAGTIGYDGSFTVYAGLAGTITWLPAPGTVIGSGQRLLTVDGQSTVLFSGQLPAWREFAPGMADGPDVRELQRNMVAGGYDPQRAIVIGDHYDWATQAAVQRWQAAHGVPAVEQNGQIPLGQVVFLPAPIRIAALSVTPGAMVMPGAAVLTATSARPVVDVTLPASQEQLVRRGQRVTVTLPGGGSTPGRVLHVDHGAASGTGQQGQSSSAGQPAAATVTLVVGLLHPSVAAGLDQAPVQVAVATQTQRNVLVAPISALLPRPGGGFQVTVVTGRTQHNVTVLTGLFDDLSGTVAISGPGITAGTSVQVPSP